MRGTGHRRTGPPGGAPPAPPPRRVSGPGRALLLLLLLPGLLLPPAAPAGQDSELDQSRQRLETVSRRLKEEQAALRKAKGEEKSLLDQLQQVEQSLVATQQQLIQLAEQIKSDREGVERTAGELEKNQRELDHQGELLGVHLRLLYGLGKQGLLRVVLGQNDPMGMAQGARYFSHLLKARQTRMEAFRHARERLDQTLRRHQEQLAALHRKAEELNQARNRLATRKEERSALLEEARREAERHQGKVAELNQARQELAQLVERLEETLAASLESAISFGEIAREKGRLPPPVRARSDEKPPGLFYRATASSPVKAVFRGRVVYADWFRGYGLLLILDHGDHTFSLYGHNQRLLVSLGDWVEAEERIALSGDTGSLEGFGLYFELRQHGKAVNPKPWMASRS